MAALREFVPDLEYRHHRAIVLDPTQPLPAGPLSVCIELALTYKLRKKQPRLGR